MVYAFSYELCHLVLDRKNLLKTFSQLGLAYKIYDGIKIGSSYGKKLSFLRRIFSLYLFRIIFENGAGCPRTLSDALDKLHIFTTYRITFVPRRIK